jgi:GntR family transcriptional regulator
MAADYREIAAALREEIVSGRYEPGAPFPTGPELAARFRGQFGEISVGTVNKAVGQLRSEGLVRTKQGRGTIVSPVPVIRRDAAGRQHRDARETGTNRGAFDAELRAAGLEPRTETEPGRAALTGAVAGILGFPEGAEAVFRRRRMYAGTEPVQLATSWIPADLAEAAPSVGQADTGPGGLYSRLADIGHGPARFTEDVRVRVPTATEARELDIDADHRVYDITRTAYDGEGRAIEVCQHVMPTHQWTLSYTWPAEG